MGIMTGAPLPPGADAVVMVEAGALEVSEDEMLGAIFRGHDEIKKITDQPVKLVIDENGQGHDRQPEQDR